jgi:hypothetical protein
LAALGHACYAEHLHLRLVAVLCIGRSLHVPYLVIIHSILIHIILHCDEDDQQYHSGADMHYYKEDLSMKARTLKEPDNARALYLPAKFNTVLDADTYFPDIGAPLCAVKEAPSIQLPLDRRGSEWMPVELGG